MDCSSRGPEGLAEVAAGIDRLIEDGVQELAETRARLSAVQRDVEAIEGRLDELRRARALVVGERTKDSAARAPLVVAPAGEIAKPRVGSLTALIRQCVTDALRSAKRPLNRVELFEVVRASGLEPECKDPVKRVGRIMWESDEFQHVGKGYWFTGEAVPPGPSNG